MKVALIHDYLSQDGGAERVLKALQELFPEAPTFVLFYNKDKLPKLFFKSEIKPSFIHYLPFAKNHYRLYLPLMPLATERHNLSGFDVIISSTSAFAKGVLTDSDTLHISYCHTPTRYLWTDTHSYIEDLSYNWLIKLILPPIISKLRMWDRMSAERVDYFLANSENVRRRIQKFYHRDAEVIYPPVEIEKFKVAGKIGNFFLTGGRLVPYKKFDITIRAFNRLGLPLKIFGTGPEEEKMKELAGPNIEFLGAVSDEEKADLYAKAIAFIHPQVEDFGITAVESMAAGRPVIAFGQGGALETVIPDFTGTLFFEQNWEAILNAVLNFAPEKFEPLKIREFAGRFSTENFKQKITEQVSDRLDDFKKGWRQEALNFLTK